MKLKFFIFCSCLFISSCVSVGTLKNTDHYYIKSKINDIPKYSDTYTEFTDDVYETPTKRQFLSLVGQLHHKFKYIKDQRDCEDAVRILRGKLCEYGYGNLSIASSKVFVFGGWHECILAVCSDGLIVYEPQSNRVKDIEHYKFKRMFF